MKAVVVFMCLLAPFMQQRVIASTDQIESCKKISPGVAGAVMGCVQADQFWGPFTTTDLVRVIHNEVQQWMPYNKAVGTDKVMLKSTRSWALLSSIVVSPAPIDSSAPIVTGYPLVLNWVAPTQNTDGTQVIAGEITGYNIYQGASAATLVKVGASVSVTYTTIPLDPGTYYFAVSASAGANESAQSPVVAATLSPTKVPVAPAAPTVQPQ